MPYKHRICGVYVITTPNGSQYIGSSINVKHRWVEHKSSLRSQSHRSERLQAAWNKHGDRLSFSMLELCDHLSLNDKEQEWIRSSVTGSKYLHVR